MTPKKLRTAIKASSKEWVGDGFHVHGLLRPTKELLPFISPFVLMDYGAPKEFPPSEKPRGVGEHPHRGFETVTLAYQGEVEHRDSSGGGGLIKPGDVQWMTAGSGLVHEEFHSKEFSKTGGMFEMVQLWVNLPKKDKMTTPKYQDLPKETMPSLDLGGTSLKVIAGEYNGQKGPASTFTPINVFDLVSTKESSLSLSLPDASNTILLVLRGKATLGGQTHTEHTALVFGREGDTLALDASSNFKGLLLNGQPIEEPIVAHGPFVMNTKEEIAQAIEDFQSGKMGRLD